MNILAYVLYIIFLSLVPGMVSASSVLNGTCEAVVNHQTLHYRLNLSFIAGTHGNFRVTNISPNFVRKGSFTLSSASKADQYEIHLIPDKNSPCLSVNDNVADGFIDCNADSYFRAIRIDPLANALRFSSNLSPVFICVMQP